MTAAGAAQGYLRRTASRHRDLVRVPGFVCTIDPHDDLRYLNYAIPDGAAGDPAAIRPVYRARGRLPRLEFVAEADPGLEARVRGAGFALEARLSLMTCDAAALVDLAPPAGVTIEPVGDVRAMLELQRRAFGDDRPVSGDDVARWSGTALLARLDGEPAGAAGMTAPEDGLSEIIGVAVTARARRRGIAAALTSAITARALDAGARVAFLTPGDEDTARVYARAGFRPSLTVLAYADP